MTNALQKQITLRHKGPSRAPNLCTYRDENKNKNHTINSREMLQRSDKSTQKPQLQARFLVKTAGLAWACLAFLRTLSIRPNTRFEIPGIPCDELNSILLFVGLTRPRSSGSKFGAKMRNQTQDSFTFVYLLWVVRRR